MRSGSFQCAAAAERPHHVVSHGVKQTDDAYLGEAAKGHPAKAAVLQAGMDVFGVAAPFVDGLALFAVHARTPVLEALRFGRAVAFVSRLALRLGGLLAGRWRAEHLYRGVSLRN